MQNCETLLKRSPHSDFSLLLSSFGLGLRNGTKGEALAAYVKEWEDGASLGGQPIGRYAQQFHEMREGDPALSPLSYKREAIDIKHVTELFGEIPLRDLTPGMIRQIEAAVRKKER